MTTISTPIDTGTKIKEIVKFVLFAFVMCPLIGTVSGAIVAILQIEDHPYLGLLHIEYLFQVLLVAMIYGAILGGSLGLVFGWIIALAFRKVTLYRKCSALLIGTLILSVPHAIFFQENPFRSYLLGILGCCFAIVYLTMYAKKRKLF